MSERNSTVRKKTASTTCREVQHYGKLVLESEVLFQGGCVSTDLDVLESLLSIIASLWESSQCPEEQQKIPALFHSEMTFHQTVLQPLRLHLTNYKAGWKADVINCLTLSFSNRSVFLLNLKLKLISIKLNTVRNAVCLILLTLGLTSSMVKASRIC